MSRQVVSLFPFLFSIVDGPHRFITRPNPQRKKEVREKASPVITHGEFLFSFVAMQ
jgi:hypothetical protein